LCFEKLNGGLRHGQPARHIDTSLLIPTILLHNKRLANDDRAVTISYRTSWRAANRPSNASPEAGCREKSSHEGHGFSRVAEELV
jgi:hypothetical protein